MAFDGIMMTAVTGELQSRLIGGRIDKIYQPEAEELILNIHAPKGNLRLLLSCASSNARVHLVTKTFENPEVPPAFCMLLRKHIQGGRIVEISQKETERIIEFYIQTIDELGFSLNKRLIVEVMGKHSNIILCDERSGKIIDSIKRISIDVNRVRQILPGKLYEYPPAQDKLPLDKIDKNFIETLVSEHARKGGDLGKSLLSKLQGFSPAAADTLASFAETADRIYAAIENLRAELADIAQGHMSAPLNVYLDEKGAPKEFHILRLSEFEDCCEKKEFDTVSEGIEYFFINKTSSNRVRQKSSDLERAVRASLEKLYLKKQRLSEDLLKAENSEDYRLFGELLTANIHLVQPGAKQVTVINYYDGKELTIPLDIRYSASKNAQQYFKKYGKAKTAIKEKTLQIEENDKDIQYLESVLAFAENAVSIDETEALREELTEGGYLRRRKSSFRMKKSKPAPYEYHTSEGMRVLVGRNNVENDFLTFKTAGSRDVWFHTKDIPGSHVILFAGGTPVDELSEAAVYETAAMAAYHSKARASENVPVDYVQVKYVKKPAGAKPGMVIFTNNRTVWVNPAVPEDSVK